MAGLADALTDEHNGKKKKSTPHWMKWHDNIIDNWFHFACI